MPLLRWIVPGLLQLLAATLSVPTLTMVVPLLVNVAGLTVKAPAVTFIVPLLVNVVGLIAIVWLAVLAFIVPALIIVLPGRFDIDPKPCTFTPASICSV